MNYRIEIRRIGRRWDFHKTLSSRQEAWMYVNRPDLLGLVGEFRVREIPEATEEQIAYFVDKWFAKIGAARMSVARGWCEGIGEFTAEEQLAVLFLIGDNGGIK